MKLQFSSLLKIQKKHKIKPTLENRKPKFSIFINREHKTYL